MSLPVRIGIIDTGVNPTHPHVGNIIGGITVSSDGEHPSYGDQLGHGTAIAALLHQQAPEAQLFAVKIFDRTLATNRETVIRAIHWCLKNDMDIINLSLGSANDAHRTAFQMAARLVQATGKAIVSAYEVNGTLALPGCLPGVIGVIADPARNSGTYGIEPRSDKMVFSACPYPREIPGVPRHRNLNGVSFAVAHISAAVARLWTPANGSREWEFILANAIPEFQAVTASHSA